MICWISNLEHLVMIKKFFSSLFFSICYIFCRDNEIISLSNYARCSEEGCTCKTSLSNSLEGSSGVSYSVTLQLRKGFYHDRYSDIVKVKI